MKYYKIKDVNDFKKAKLKDNLWIIIHIFMLTFIYPLFFIILKTGMKSLIASGETINIKDGVEVLYRTIYFSIAFYAMLFIQEIWENKKDKEFFENKFGKSEGYKPSLFSIKLIFFIIVISLFILSLVYFKFLVPNSLEMYLM